MPVLVEDPCRLLVQGLGRDGSFQAQRILEYGTNMVAAVHPNRAGMKFMDEVPYFETAKEAVAATGANTGLAFVPAPFAMDAILEQADAGISLIVSITEGVPVQDMMRAKAYLDRTNSRLLGPNCPGLIHPGERIKLGIIPGAAVNPGNVGVVSRSGTLTYEAAAQLNVVGLGQSTCVGIGGDPIPGRHAESDLRLGGKSRAGIERRQPPVACASVGCRAAGHGKRPWVDVFVADARAIVAAAFQDHVARCVAADRDANVPARGGFHGGQARRAQQHRCGDASGAVLVPKIAVHRPVLCSADAATCGIRRDPDRGLADIAKFSRTTRRKVVSSSSLARYSRSARLMAVW